VLDLLFSETSHNEIIKRSVELLKFLYKHDRFGVDYLDKIWSEFMTKHESDREVLFQLCSDLLDVLSFSDLGHIFSKLSEIPMSEIDSNILGLIKSIASKSVYQKS
jgi:hypothetical protein